ncbi:MAG TPA: cytochrome c [candidate division Zixibacteria bacterium]|nr:cytochrome c [candidate division Zixibacteria bacterium]
MGREASLRLVAVAVFCLSCLGCGRNERIDALYAERCLNCHGPLGRGDGPLAASLPRPVPDFRETVERKSPFEIRRSIAEGRGTMPAFSPALRQSEITDMVKMVRFLSREGREVRWWERFDMLVAAHCSVPWEYVFGTEPPSEREQP